MKEVQEYRAQERYGFCLAHGEEFPVTNKNKADAALAEAYAVIERQARMLEVAVDWLAETEAWPTNATEAILADLARRAEEEADHD